MSSISVEILSKQKVIGVPGGISGELKVGVVEPQRHLDGTIYRIDVRFPGITDSSSNYELTFQHSLGGGFDRILEEGVGEKTRRINEQLAREIDK